MKKIQHHSNTKRKTQKTSIFFSGKKKPPTDYSITIHNPLWPITLGFLDTIGSKHSNNRKSKYSFSRLSYYTSRKEREPIVIIWT